MTHRALGPTLAGQGISGEQVGTGVAVAARKLGVMYTGVAVALSLSVSQ